MWQERVDEYCWNDWDQKDLPWFWEIPRLDGGEDGEEERNNENSQNSWQSTVEVPIPRMSSIETSNAFKNVRFKELEGSYDERSMEVGVESS